jgi:hypothetical protein
MKAFYLFLILFPFSLLATEAIFTVAPSSVPLGQRSTIRIRGTGFSSNMTVAFDGAGITVVPPIIYQNTAQRRDGDPKDTLDVEIDVSADAMPLIQKLKLTFESGNVKEKFNAISLGGTPAPGGVMPGGAMPGGAMPGGAMPGGAMVAGAMVGGAMGGQVVDNRYDDLPPRVPGQIDVITEASPSLGEPGAQVNIWIAGRDFANDAQVKFSIAGMGAAYYNNAPIPHQVVKKTLSSNKNLDGILYYARIPDDAPLGPVSITVSSPSSGSSKTQDGLFSIVPRGQGMPIDMGEDNVSEVTGASPAFVRAGLNSAVWVWGLGFNLESQLEYSNPSIKKTANARVVVESQSNLGYSGIQSFINILPNAPTGPVDLTVINPNGSSKTGVGLVQVIAPATSTNTNGGTGTDDPEIEVIEDSNYNGDCPDFETVAEELVAVTPKALQAGTKATITIKGLGFACGASVMISGGGLAALSDSVFFVDENGEGYFKWNIEVKENAMLGKRKVTVVNPNGTSVFLEDGFEVQGIAVSGCQSHDLPLSMALSFSLILMILMIMRRRSI